EFHQPGPNYSNGRSGGMARTLEVPAHSSHAFVRCDAPSSILGLIRPRPGMTACGGTSISLGARLCHLAARLTHSGGCGIRHQPRVAENRAELVSLAETSNGRLGSIGMHARDLAALASFRADGLDRPQHFRILRIEGRRLPHAEREVRGSDIDT